MQLTLKFFKKGTRKILKTSFKITVVILYIVIAAVLVNLYLTCSSVVKLREVVEVQSVQIKSLKSEVENNKNDCSEIHKATNDRINDDFNLMTEYVDKYFESLNNQIRLNKSNLEYMKFSEEDLYIFEQTVYLESGGESVECQMAVGSCILNRMVNENKSLQEVVYEPGQFDVAPNIGIASVSDKTKWVCKVLLKYGPSLPTCVTSFRTETYHNFDCINPYCQIGPVYFSHDTRYCNDIGGCQYEQSLQISD